MVTDERTGQKYPLADCESGAGVAESGPLQRGNELQCLRARLGCMQDLAVPCDAVSWTTGIVRVIPLLPPLQTR